MPQKMIYYNQDVCFSRNRMNSSFDIECSWHEVDKFYHPVFYKNEEAFDIGPDDDVIVIMINCGSHWFGHGTLNHVIFTDDKFCFPAFRASYRLCIWIKNICQQKTPKRNTTIHVPANTPLSKLLTQSEIIYKLGFVSEKELALANHKFFPPPQSVPSLPGGPTTFETSEEAYDYYEHMFNYASSDDDEDDMTPTVHTL